MAPTPIDKKWIVAIAIGVPLLRKAFSLWLASRAKEPRLCPRCAYRMVDEVGRRMTRKGGRVGYWRCSACAARYKQVNDGPLETPADVEWTTHVPFHFPR